MVFVKGVSLRKRAQLHPSHIGGCGPQICWVTAIFCILPPASCLGILRYVPGRFCASVRNLCGTPSSYSSACSVNNSPTAFHRDSMAQEGGVETPLSNRPYLQLEYAETLSQSFTSVHEARGGFQLEPKLQVHRSSLFLFVSLSRSRSLSLYLSVSVTPKCETRD